MLSRIDARVRPYYDTVIRLSVRDTGVMVAWAALMCALVWYNGHPRIAACVAVWIAATEIALRLIVTRSGPLAAINRTMVLRLTLALRALGAVLYLLPTLSLAGDPSLAMKISGLIFAMGMQVYLANAWSGVPVFIYALLVPSIIMLSLAFLRLGATPAETSSQIEWSMATAVLVLFIYAAVDTLRQHIATQQALFRAERDAARQLSLLRDTQRLDPLTGVLNRTAFDRGLKTMLDDRARDGTTIAVYLMDVDAFKPINDTYSHDAGDAVLRQIAERLEDVIGASGIVARLGGDEFICAVGNVADGADAMALGRLMQRRITKPIGWDDRDLSIRVSLGIAITGADEDAPEATVPALCSAADRAMFAAKSAPDGDPILFRARDFAPQLSAEDRRALVSGISARDIRPHYQPKVHLLSKRIIGFEALARWTHPSQTDTPQADFIAQINDFGLQGDFMLSMTRQVAEDICAMLEAGLDPGQVSLNVPEVALATRSGRDDLRGIIEDHAAAIPYLTLEITEDVFIARAATAIQTSIAEFRALGLRISLDDFGTGFASFNHLRELDFDELKIDTAFIAGLGQDATTEVLVRGFLAIATGLGVAVVAEGVETEDQRRDLINMGCLTAQGYLFSRAVPLDEAAALLRLQSCDSGPL